MAPAVWIVFGEMNGAAAPPGLDFTERRLPAAHPYGQAAAGYKSAAQGAEETAGTHRRNGEDIFPQTATTRKHYTHFEVYGKGHRTNYG